MEEMIAMALRRDEDEGEGEPIIIPVYLEQSTQECRLYTFVNSPADVVRWWQMPFHEWVTLAGLHYGLAIIHSDDDVRYGLLVSTQSILHDEVSTVEELKDDWFISAIRMLAQSGPVTAVSYYECLSHKFVVEAYRIHASSIDRERE